MKSNEIKNEDNNSYIKKLIKIIRSSDTYTKSLLGLLKKLGSAL